jgi:hypothetical protein
MSSENAGRLDFESAAGIPLAGFTALQCVEFGHFHGRKASLDRRDFLFQSAAVEPWLGQQVLRRSKIFIASALKIAISSVGAASNRVLQAGICIVGHAAH